MGAPEMIRAQSHTLAGLTPAQHDLILALAGEVALLVKEHPCLQLFCTDATYVRYLKARSWSVPKAAKMLHATLEWRLTFQPHAIKWSDVAVEAQGGKQQIWTTADRAGRPVLIFRPRLENVHVKDMVQPRQVKFLVYHLEALSALGDTSGVGKATWLLDLGGRVGGSSQASVSTALQCMHILQNHYPERLGLAICYYVPILFWLTWKALAPFLDPVTKEKIAFVSNSNAADMHKWFDLSQMDPCCSKNGAPDTQFLAAQYDAMMDAFDAEREAMLQVVQGGGKGSLNGPPGLAKPLPLLPHSAGGSGPVVPSA